MPVWSLLGAGDQKISAIRKYSPAPMPAIVAQSRICPNDRAPATRGMPLAHEFSFTRISTLIQMLTLRKSSRDQSLSGKFRRDVSDLSFKTARSCALHINNYVEAELALWRNVLQIICTSGRTYNAAGSAVGNEPRWSCRPLMLHAPAGSLHTCIDGVLGSLRNTCCKNM